MRTLPLKLTLLLIPVLLISSCAPQTPSKPTPPIQQTLTLIQPISTPTPEATHPPKGSQGPQSQKQNTYPTSSYIPATADFNIILGRPTTNSITMSLYARTDLKVSIAYGTSPGHYTSQAETIDLKAFTPQAMELSDLAPDTSYFYSATVNGTPAAEHSFHTARPPGTPFTFTIDADPHNRDPRFNGELYAATLTNALAAHPDFHINLGDTFMTEKLKPQTIEEAASTFTDMRPFFGILDADAPLFLVNGNHEGELGWLLTRGQDQHLPIWSTQLRQAYYPNPIPNPFYSGSSSIDPYLQSVRDGYYAWKWGDALFIVLDPFWYTESKPKPEDHADNWHWTLGREQYDWLRQTLETSESTYKFIFIHHLVGGAELNGAARGGVEFADLWEWGGDNADGSYGFEEHRPGWGLPIHQLLVANHVTAVFHGHDHVFVKQELDGIVYQECPQSSNADTDNTRLAAEYGYVHGEVVLGSGHLQVTVSPEQVKVDFIQASLSASQNRQILYSYTIAP